MDYIPFCFYFLYMYIYLPYAPRFGDRDRVRRTVVTGSPVTKKVLDHGGDSCYSYGFDTESGQRERTDLTFKEVLEVMGATCSDILSIKTIPIHTVDLAPNFAALQYFSPWPVFHLVTLLEGKRHPRRSLFPGGLPSPKMLTQFASEWTAQARGHVAELLPSSLRPGMLVDRVIDFVRATKFLSELRQLRNSKTAYTRVIVKDTCPQEYLQQDDSNYEAMRKARCQLDCVAMLLWRYYYRTIDQTSAWLYLFVDASPQWRGTELLASSFDIISFQEDGSSTCIRRLLPQISIARHMYSTVGKTVSLLWQLFLMFGPSFLALRMVCNQVAGFTSDLGTERRIPRRRDILIPFCRMLKVYVPRWAKPQKYLFPNCLLSAGWFHLWDGVIRFGLCSLPWFDLFTRSLKALVRWLREDMEDIAGMLREGGLHGAADVMELTKLPTFIAWRWGTIHEVCKALVDGISIIRANAAVIFQALGKLQDDTRRRLIRVAIESVDWLNQFRFVSWFSDHMCCTQNWGGSCDCCREKFEAGEKYECYNRGRLIHIAFQFATQRLDDFLAQVNSWDMNHWGNVTTDWFNVVQSMCRAVFQRASQKILFLDEIPYLISRIGLEPDAGRRCIAQYDSAPKSKHDVISIDTLDSSSPLRGMIEALAPKLPQKLEPPLNAVVLRIRMGNLLDKLAEGPHSIFRRIGMHSRRSEFPWQSATMRLKQNLEDVEWIPKACSVDLQQLWDSWKSVIQPFRKRNVHLRRKVFLQRVYRCAHKFADDQDGDADDEVSSFGGPYFCIVLSHYSTKNKHAEK